VTLAPTTASSLTLLRVPFVFTQDELFDVDGFVKAAEKRGLEVDRGAPADLHHHGILIPLFRIVDDIDESTQIQVEGLMGYNPSGWVVTAARQGRLRDPTQEEVVPALYDEPRTPDRDQHTGYYYSSWQLLQIRTALTQLAWARTGQRVPPAQGPSWRDVTLVLCALAPRHLPGVLGEMRLISPTDEEQERYWTFQREIDGSRLVETVGFAGDQLAGCAETLLSRARVHDPMTEWLSLLRHSPYRAWSRMRGAPLHAMWHRAAAEVLLRAHEEIADSGNLEPLRDLTGETWFTAQHDRLSPRYEEAHGLEQALATFGLSPHPRVLLLLEGSTEMEHVPRLLDTFGLGEPDRVRVLNTKSSKVHASLVARHNITPRIGRERPDGWDLLSSQTALILAMDPENFFATPAMCDDVRRRLQNAIREEVRAQGADIGQGDLDLLVTVQTWGEDTYELANFTDDELVPAIRQIAASRRHDVTSETWEPTLRAALLEARASHADIKAAFHAIQLADPKVELARLLWPALREKCAAEEAAGTKNTPVLQIVHYVLDRVNAMDRASVLGKPRS
jgi:hypothetical protein